MRFRIIVSALPILIAACSPETSEGSGNAGQIVAIPTINYEEITREYELRLQDAPIYHSSIRAELISRADEYRQSYRPLIDRYRGLEPSFRCPYPVYAIERAQDDGWELVRCDISGAVFLKRLGAPRRCKGMPAIPDHFATLQLRFGIDRLRRGANTRLDAAAFIFAQEILAPVTVLPPSMKEQMSVGAATDRIEYATRKLSGLTAFYLLDRQEDALVVLHRADNPTGCSRNAFGLILGDGAQATVDMPTEDYGQMRDQLTKAIRYLDQDV